MKKLLQAIERFALAADCFEHVRETDPMITITAPLSELRRLRAAYKTAVRKNVA